MGCWNQTCSLTTLPITYGDEIVLIPLVENYNNPIAGLTYYVNDNYEVFGLPIYGKYNDYGGIEDVNTHPSNIKFYTESQLFEYKTNRNHEDADLVEFNKENLDDFFSNYICEEVTYTNYNHKCKNLSFMMVHKGLYNKLIEEMGNVIPYKQEKTLRELHCKRIKNTIQEIKDKQKEFEEFDEFSGLVEPVIAFTMSEMIAIRPTRTAAQLAKKILRRMIARCLLVLGFPIFLPSLISYIIIIPQ